MKLRPVVPQPPHQPTNNNAAYWSGLVVSALVALTAHLSDNGDPLSWRDWLEVASVVSIAVNGYLIRR